VRIFAISTLTSHPLLPIVCDPSRPAAWTEAALSAASTARRSVSDTSRAKLGYSASRLVARPSLLRVLDDLDVGLTVAAAAGYDDAHRLTEPPVGRCEPGKVSTCAAPRRRCRSNRSDRPLIDATGGAVVAPFSRGASHAVDRDEGVRPSSWPEPSRPSFVPWTDQWQWLACGS
jgi:hypothetical protein